MTNKLTCNKSNPKKCCGPIVVNNRCAPVVCNFGHNYFDYADIDVELPSGGSPRTIFKSASNKGEKGLINIFVDDNDFEIILVPASGTTETPITIKDETSPTIAFENIKEIKARTLSGERVDFEYAICIIKCKCCPVELKHIEAESEMELPDNSEKRDIFISNKGQNGMITIENRDDDGDVEVTLVSDGGIAIPPITIKEESSMTITFENIKEITARAVNASSDVEIDYAISILQ